MSPHTFSERFLLWKLGLTESSDGGSREVDSAFDTVGDAKRELRSFVDALDPFTQGNPFPNIHPIPDIERDKLALYMGRNEQNNIPDEDSSAPFSKDILAFRTGSDIKNHAITFTQTMGNERWTGWTPEIIRACQYRIKLEGVGRKLTEFSSSRELVSAIADAMEAHDRAFFDAQILHRDVSVGNILLSEDGKGLLIDWDLCSKVDPEGSTSHRPSRTGTWQFMSAMLLQDPSASHEIEDDRESSFYVLVWIALRYSKHRILQPSVDLRPSSLTGDDSVGFLRLFDEVYADSSGTLKGGHLKEDFLLSVRSRLLQFDKRPKLYALLDDLNGVFKIRYEMPPSSDQIHRFNMLKAQGIPEALLQDHAVYAYHSGRENLETRGWLVETMRSYLTEDDWPDDEAEPQRTIL